MRFPFAIILANGTFLPMIFRVFNITVISMRYNGQRFGFTMGTSGTNSFLFPFFRTGRFFYRLPFTVTMVKRGNDFILFCGTSLATSFFFTVFGTGSLFYGFPLPPSMTFRNDNYGIFIGDFRFALFVRKIFMTPGAFPIFDISVFCASNGFCGVIFQTMLVFGNTFITADRTGIDVMFGFTTHNIVSTSGRMPMICFVAFPLVGEGMLVFEKTFISTDCTRIAVMFGFAAHNVMSASGRMPMVCFVAFPLVGECMTTCRNFFLFCLITYRTGVSLFALFRASWLFGYNAVVPNMFGFTADNVVPASSDMPMIYVVIRPFIRISMNMWLIVVAAIWICVASSQNNRHCRT